MICMTRAETCDWIKDRQSSTRLCLSRYGDGEYLLMSGQANYMNKKGNYSRNISDKEWPLSGELRRAISTRGQLVCINELKPHNQNDVWYKAHHYFKTAGKQELYGGVHWNTFDYLNGGLVISKFFIKKTLIVSRFADILVNLLKSTNPDTHGYTVHPYNAHEFYPEYLAHLSKVASNYDNILLSCGSLSKVLLVDLIDKCSANLVDMGGVTNAIIEGLSPEHQTTKQWPMTWAKDKSLQHLSHQFLEHVRVG